MSRIKELTGLNNVEYSIETDVFLDHVIKIVIRNNSDNRGKDILSSFDTDSAKKPSRKMFIHN